MPAPEWATTLYGVKSSASRPWQRRESLATLATELFDKTAAGATRDREIYDIPDLYLAASPDSKTQLLTGFKAYPFTEPASGMVYVRARWYDPETGTWLSPDPLGYRDSSNLYAFAGGDPVNETDPTGLALYAFDGTWNDRTKMQGHETNSAKLFDVYGGPNKQYEVGVGNKWYSSWVGGATGLGGRARLNEAYKALEEFYNSGDHDIDIIGFSRGAAEAREFANLINERGVYNRATGKVDHPPVRFLGVFDTVASFGIPGNDINLGYNLKVAPNVQTARQAIAANEYRGTFPLSRLENPKCPDPRVEEQPFPGSHSDVGGGYEDNQHLSREALKWMWAQMKAAGLPVDELSEEDLNDTDPAKVHKSYRSWMSIPTWVRVAWAHHQRRKPSRKTYYPPCTQPRLEAGR
ncbi:MAG: DUF2235 domain-containing protein [Thermoanaerobaculia bacterium]